MDSIITATIVLAMVHALIPNHWLPLVAIAKTENWSKKELMVVTFIASLAHVMGTVLLGLILGWIGIRLAHTYSEYLHIIAPVLLILFGLIYFTINFKHQHAITPGAVLPRKSKGRWIVLFVLIMFLSPCLEVESLFLAAGAYGIHNILWLGAVYALVSITGITTLVVLAFTRVRMIRVEFIEHYEKRITGMVLIAVGIITFFIH
jgi:nickel/cobalt exporter